MNLAIECLTSEIDLSDYSLLKISHDNAFIFCDSKVTFKNESCAFFGGWIWKDTNTNSQFILECERWARSKGIRYLIGPYDYSTYFNYRLRTDCFNRAPFAGEPTNQLEDVQFLKQLGFSSIQNYETYHFGNMKDLIQLADDNLTKISTKVAEKSLYFSTTHPQEILDQLKDFYLLSHEIFQDNFLYRPIPFSAFSKYFQFGLAPQICWQSTSLLKEKDTDKILGYSLNFKDPLNSKRLLIKTAGIHPEYRFMGLSFIGLTLFSIEKAKENYSELSICLMRSGNYPTLLTSKLTFDKQNYALFGKRLT
ncbi:MAG: hypothetical protein ACK5V3_03260 [Bdellovibrionales bacterium]